MVPTIVITPPPSPDLEVGHHAHSAEPSWSMYEPNPFYLQPPPYLHFPHRDYLRESRHRSLERHRHEGSLWRTLIAVILLLITSSSLYGMYSLHLSEAQALDDLAAGLARQEPDEGARIPNPHSEYPSVVPFRFELPRFLEWLAVDSDGLDGPTLLENQSDETPRTRGVSILGVIGVVWRHSQAGDAWHKLGIADGVVDLGVSVRE